MFWLCRGVFCLTELGFIKCYVRVDGKILMPGGFVVEEKLFTMGVVKYWLWLAREVMAEPFLEIFLETIL